VDRATRLEKVARLLGRGLGIIGLAMVYLSLIISLLQIVAPREPVLRAGFITAAVGCLLMLGALVWPHRDKGRVLFEATAGILCLPLGVVGGVLAEGDELGPQAPWIVITPLFIGLAVALVAQAARVKQASERWRNPGQRE